MIESKVEIIVRCDSCDKKFLDDIYICYCEKCANNIIHVDNLFDAMCSTYLRSLEHARNKKEQSVVHNYKDAYFWLLDAFGLIQRYESRFNKVFRSNL